MIVPWTGSARGKVIQVTERRREGLCGDDAGHDVVVSGEPRFNEIAI